MSDASREFSELQDLLDQLMLGTLNAAGHAKLDELVVADLGARRQYINRMFLIGELRFRLGKVATTASLPMPAFLHPVSLRTRISSVVPQFIQRRPVTWSMLAAGLLFAAYITLISWGMLDRGGNAGQSTAQSGRSAAPDAVATIRDAANVQWADFVGKSLGDLPGASRRDAPTDVAAGESLGIDSGLVELELKQGVKLLIEGPAQWTIDGGNHATLRRGKLLAEVPQQAIGFTLTTPTAKIVDLGTEFGVQVAHDGKSELHVRHGIVEVSAVSDRSSKNAVRLRAGQAARISAGDQSVLPISAESVRFDLRARSAAALGPIQIANPSFELPAVVPPLEAKRPEGWFVTAAEATADAGLQVGGDGQFLFWNEPAGSLGQFIGGHRVPAAGITYRLKFRVAVGNVGRCQLTARLLFNELTDEKRTLKLELTECPWRTVELTCTTTAQDVGKRVGVAFEFETLAPGVQVSLDEVTLEAQNPTENPEANK